MELKGSKTEANLQAAFAGESMATNKYTYFASKAKKDGYQQIAAIFEETAANEREHAKMWYKLINGGIDSTLENLGHAAEGENYEWTDMYRKMAEARNILINNVEIVYVSLLSSEPIDVGTDDNNIYERVIEVDFYYKVEKGE